MSHLYAPITRHTKRPSTGRRVIFGLASLLLADHLSLLDPFKTYRSAQAATQSDKRVDYQAELPKAPPAGAAGFHTPPPHGEYPKGPFGEAVKRGEALFNDTQNTAGDYVGNGLNCANCHIDGGRKADSAPLWGAWVAYPTYRKKNDHVNTMEERIRGCFTYSMNAKDSKIGHAPEPGDPLLTDMQTYMYWLTTGAPTGEKLPGRGYPKLDKPPKPYSPERGAKLYADNCAMCHGEKGEGTQLADGSYAFPALWGKDSFNWGAGMHRVNTAAAFIKANMPLSKPNSLDLQDAWDIAAFMNHHERPSDPRNKDDLAANDAQFHQHACYYGDKADGHTLGTGTGN